MIKRSFIAFSLFLIIAGSLIPAPLQAPFDKSDVPNPVKAGWFLLWIQELVSYNAYMVYLAGLIFAFFLFLPKYGFVKEQTGARWGFQENLPAKAIFLTALAVIIILTVVAYFFRGADWALVL